MVKQLINFSNAMVTSCKTTWRNNDYSNDYGDGNDNNDNDDDDVKS
jgi:hypothetical protein